MFLGPNEQIISEYWCRFKMLLRIQDEPPTEKRTASHCCRMCRRPAGRQAATIGVVMYLSIAVCVASSNTDEFVKCYDKHSLLVDTKVECLLSLVYCHSKRWTLAAAIRQSFTPRTHPIFRVTHLPASCCASRGQSLGEIFLYFTSIYRCSLLINRVNVNFSLHNMTDLQRDSPFDWNNVDC